MKNKILFLFMIFIFTFISVSAYVDYDYQMPQRKSEKEIVYTPWITNYTLQTDEMKLNGINGGLGGQRTYSLAVSPFNPDVILLGVDTTAMWRTHDGGGMWYSCSDILRGQSVVDIMFDPYNEGVVYCINTPGFDRKYIDRYDFDGMYKSTDNGLTWNLVLSADYAVKTAKSNHLIAFDNSGAVYTYCIDGVKKSVDGGTNWIDLGGKAIRDNTDAALQDLYVSNDGQTIIIADSIYGITASFNGGGLWKSKNSADMQNSDGNVCVYSIVVNPDNQNHWIASTGYTKMGHLYESTDSGEIWADLGATLTNNGTPWERPVCSMVYTNRISNGNRRIFAVLDQASKPLKYSDDYGRTWFEPQTNNETGYFSAPVAYLNNTDKVYFAFENSIKSSNDNGTSFSGNCNGYTGLVARNLKFDYDGRLYVPLTDFGWWETNGAFDSDNLSTVKWHNNTKRFDGSQTMGDMDIDPNDQNHMIAAIGSYGNMILSDGRYNTEKNDWEWTHIEETQGYGAYTFVKFHPTDKNTIYTSHFISRDGGTDWDKNPDGLRILSISKHNPNYVAACLNLDNKYYLAVSYDKGIEFNTICELGENSLTIEFDVSNPNIVWCSGGISGTLYKVDIVTGEYEIFNTKNGLPGERAYAFAQNPNNPKHLITGGFGFAPIRGGGLYESLNGGVSWREIVGVPAQKLIYSISFIPDEKGKALVGSYSGTLIYDSNEYQKYCDMYENYSESKVFGKKYDTVKEYSDYLYTEDNPSTLASSIVGTLGTRYTDDTHLQRITTYEGGCDTRIVCKWNLLSYGELKSVMLNISNHYCMEHTGYYIYKTDGTLDENNMPKCIGKPIIYELTGNTDDRKLEKSIDVTSLIDNGILNICVMVKETFAPISAYSVNNGYMNLNYSAVNIDIDYSKDNIFQNPVWNIADNKCKVEFYTNKSALLPVMAVYEKYSNILLKCDADDNAVPDADGKVKAEFDLSEINSDTIGYAKLLVFDNSLNIEPLTKPVIYSNFTFE